jgi:16S rRNA (guanine(527)-N(7))-methyltransferase GidB
MATMEELLINGAAELGVPLDSRALDRFAVFTDELLSWNRVTNLTAITQPEEIALKHYLDSIALLRYVQIQEGVSLADVGCGAGFPGIPLKIARGDLSLCCIDSLGKRVNFLETLVKKLELSQCSCVHARAEEAGANPQFRGHFDYAAARAVARLRVLCEYCLPLVKTGGAFIAMKGGDSGEEIAEAQNAIRLLGGETEAVFSYTLPQSDIARTIAVIRKVRATPEKYPRSNAKIAKSPL